MRLFGLPVTAATGKLLFPTLSLLVILASGGYYVEALRNNDRPAKTKNSASWKNPQKLGNRLVRAEIIRDTGSIFVSKDVEQKFVFDKLFLVTNNSADSIEFYNR